MKKIYLPIGSFGKPHNILGAINFFPCEWIIDFILSKKQNVFYQNASKFVPLKITEVKCNQQKWIVKFAIFNHREQVEKLKNTSLFILKNQFSKISKLWYWPDLIGYKVKYQEIDCGTLINFFNTPAHLIGEIKTSTGKKYFIPLVDHYLKSIIKTEKIIKVKESILELKNHE